MRRPVSRPPRPRPRPEPRGHGSPPYHCPLGANRCTSATGVMADSTPSGGLVAPHPTGKAAVWHVRGRGWTGRPPARLRAASSTSRRRFRLMGRARRRPARPARAPARPAVPARHQGRSPAHSDLHSYARVVNKPPDWPPRTVGRLLRYTARIPPECGSSAIQQRLVRSAYGTGVHPAPTRTPHPCPSHSSAIRVNADRSGHAHTPSADNGAARKDGPPQSRRTRSALPGLAAPRAARAPVPR